MSSKECVTVEAIDIALNNKTINGKSKELVLKFVKKNLVPQSILFSFSFENSFTCEVYGNT